MVSKKNSGNTNQWNVLPNGMFYILQQQRVQPETGGCILFVFICNGASVTALANVTGFRATRQKFAVNFPVW